MCFHDVEQSVHDSCRSSELSHSAEQVAYVSNSEEAKRLSQLPRHAVMAKVGQARGKHLVTTGTSFSWEMMRGAGMG